MFGDIEVLNKLLREKPDISGIEFLNDFLREKEAVMSYQFVDTSDFVSHIF
jgi:hypothetical protein